MTDATDGSDDMPTSLLRMKFEGGRFDLHILPASALVELSRLSRIFVALAEDSWRKDHPDRQRVPFGFAQRFELCLLDVTGGSAVPILVDRDQVSSQFSGIAPVATEAARRLEEAFIAIVRFNQLPTDFPTKAERDVASCFSSLATDEYPTFGTEDGRTYNYTQHARSNFLKTRTTIAQPSSGRVAGRLIELDTEKRSAQLRMLDGRVIAARYLPQVQQDMRASISIPDDERFAIMECDYLVQNGAISEVTDIAEVFLISLPNTPAGQVLRELLTDDPSGEVDAVTLEAAESTGEVLRSLDSLRLPSPAIFPSHEGSIQLVWRHDGQRQTVELTGPQDIEMRTYRSATGERTGARWDLLSEFIAELPGLLSVDGNDGSVR